MEAGNPGAGVYRRCEVNSELLPQWLIYVKVDDVEASLQNHVNYGDKAWKEAPNPVGRLKSAVIHDPAGAVLALI